jgi:hypothetical protein
VRRPLRFLRGGSDGNEQLTAIVGSLLIVLLAVEGATLLDLRGLLTVHAFVGMLLVPVVVLKLGSTGWRMARYYLRGEEYTRRGPPHIFLRALVAPLTVVTTVVLFATGIALLALGQTEGTLVGLHKAAFILWLPVTAVHVLARLPRLGDALRQRLAGTSARIAIGGAALVAGLALATLTLPAADHLQDEVSAYAGIDAA